MTAADNFYIRRNAYCWASVYEVYEHEITGHGEREANAVWCAFTYIHDLVGKILRRKAMVDAAVAAQIAIRDASSESSPHPPVEGRQSDPQGPSSTTNVRLINSFSGEVYWTVQMPTWAVLGDAVVKANTEFDDRRRAERASEPGEADESNVENWTFAVVDESRSRCRIHEVRAPGQDFVELKVCKVTLASTRRTSR